MVKKGCHVIYAVMGYERVSAARLIHFASLHAPTISDLTEWADAYAQLAPSAGIRTVIAFAQALHETDWFRFTERAQPDWNNPAGIGVGAASGAIDCHFATKELGVRAHLGHLLAYYDRLTTDSTVKGFCVLDPRHFPHRAYENDIRMLNGHWATPGTTYGESIAALAEQIWGEA
jgi:N-acetylmuramoyl-L-alanine amidase